METSVMQINWITEKPSVSHHFYMSGIKVPFADAFSGFLCNFANNCDVTVGASAYQCGGRSNQRWLHSNKWHDLPAPADRVSQRSWCFPADKQIARAKNNKHDDELRRRSRGAFRPACRKQSLTCQHLMPQAASFVHRNQVRLRRRPGKCAMRIRNETWRTCLFARRKRD